MGRKKKLTTQALIDQALANPVSSTDIDQYKKKLDEDPEYSLEPDPTGCLAMSDKEKTFIKNYIQFRNIPIAAQLTQISQDEGEAFYRSLSFKSEVRRLNNAMYQRQFATKMLTVDQIGGYLSSLLQDQVPEVDRLSSKDKPEVAKMLIEMNVMKSAAVNDPVKYNVIEVEAQVKDLSVRSIKALISQSKQTDEESKKKEQMITELDKDNSLTNDDLMYLRSLPASELLKLLDEQHQKLAAIDNAQEANVIEAKEKKNDSK